MSATGGAEGSLGEIIRRQRELGDYSMRKFAELAGISNPYLSQIERGLREPSERVLEAITDTLRVTTDSLYAEAGIDPKGEPDISAVVEAIRADTHLTGRQQKSLIEIYEAFRALNPDRPSARPRRARG